MATLGEVRSAAAGVVLTTDLIETASADVLLTDAATIAIDWDTGINFTVQNVAGNRVIGNPTNGQPGTWRTVYLYGSNSTDRIITFGNNYFGEVPTITDLDDTRHYMLSIFCRSATHFIVSSKRAFG